MNIDLPYGKSKRTIRMPVDVKVDFLLPKEKLPLEDPEAAFASACRSPVDSFSLDDIARGCGKVVILICDVTRDGGTAQLLTCCVRYLKGLDVKTCDINIIVARGAHRKRSKEEKQFFKEGDLKGTQVEEHNCDNAESMTALLLTTRGTPVRVNRKLKEGHPVILLSPISFHYFAGFGGGRKLILPGAADRNSINANHRLSLLDSKPVTLNPLCRASALEGNPVHEDMCEALDALENLFAVNFFSDTSRRIVFVNAGSPGSSHMEACEEYSKAFSYPLENRYDILLLSPGGYPYDINLLQSHKAIRHASFALKKEGSMFVAAECSEGVGSAPLEEALKKPKDTFLMEAYREYQLNNQTAVSLYNLTEDFEVGMVTEMEEKLLLDCGIKPCNNPEAYLAAALAKSGSSRIAVLPYGCKTLPRLIKEVHK